MSVYWQRQGWAKKDGAEEVHRLGKAEDGGDEICSSEKTEETRRNRRAARMLRVDARARFRAGELVMGTFSVSTLAFNGNYA